MRSWRSCRARRTTISPSWWSWLPRSARQTPPGVTILRENAFHVRVTHGIDPFVCPARDTFCRHTMDVDGVVCIEDARSDPRFEHIGWVDGTIAKARFYASAPLYAPTGEMVGRLCVIDSEVRGLTTLQHRSLEAIALSVTQLIELRLLRASRPEPPAPDVGQATATVVSQLAAELSHDMKVPLTAIIASVEMLAEELGDEPGRAVDALLNRTTRAADRMARMLEQNMDFGVVGTGAAPVDVDLDAVARQLLLDSSLMLQRPGSLGRGRATCPSYAPTPTTCTPCSRTCSPTR